MENTTETKKRRNLYNDIKALIEYIEFCAINDTNDVKVIPTTTNAYAEAQEVMEFHNAISVKRNGKKLNSIVSKVETMTQAERLELIKRLNLQNTTTKV